MDRLLCRSRSRGGESVALGIWDEAKKKRQELDETAEHQRRAHADLEEARRRDVQAQQSAVGEFVDAMRGMGIPTKKHRWVVTSNWTSWNGGTRRSWRSGPTGWGVQFNGSTRLVVTEDGRVYDLARTGESSVRQMMPPTSLDLAAIQSFRKLRGGDFYYETLVDLLRDELARAM